MSKDDSFPSIHGQIDVKGLAFQILDAPSSFSVCLHLTSCVVWNIEILVMVTLQNVVMTF